MNGSHHEPNSSTAMNACASFRNLLAGFAVTIMGLDTSMAQTLPDFFGEHYSPSAVLWENDGQ